MSLVVLLKRCARPCASTTGSLSTYTTVFAFIRWSQYSNRIYLKDIDPAVTDQAWQRFLAALEPLNQAGKLGAILFQFPPWFPISRVRKEYIVACAERAAPRRICVEFLNRTWMTPHNQQETLDFRPPTSCRMCAWTCPRATGTQSRRWSP